jgi:squalene-hopene/tetraprenyl-beta-curcumene cyclase
MSALDRERLNRAVARVNQELLAAIGPDGYWVGELSSSALSTATAVTALALVQRESQTSNHQSEIESGLAWLARNQNSDGGWGDTVLSLSNLSTTTLCWAAFGAVPGAGGKFASIVCAAEKWIVGRIAATAGSGEGGAPASIDTDTLARAIIARYGKDRTFSVPILTMCALAGRLGTGRDAWMHVIPLPFELAACPHSWFAALRLPVVSYALPALIAIGQVRHKQSPSRNPLAHAVRNLTQARTLRKLETIQPANGGFLEATPLTSFVTMSLAGSGQASHPVARKGVEFLIASQRADGSWPIDTNLATWVTTLSVNALGEPGTQNPKLRSTFRAWLLNQQYRTIHPYTHAAPGGWAWTDLPGGVPDADDTAGALLALRQLGTLDEATREAAIAGVTWLLGLQNRDGGIPTFCRGWGALPFDQSSADITAHAIRAWLAWKDLLPELDSRLTKAIHRAVKFLARTARPDGTWLPLWFGNQWNEGDENPLYGTARVVNALSQLHEPAALKQAVIWLVKAQQENGGWSGALSGATSVEETALAVEALCDSMNALTDAFLREAATKAIHRGVNWLLTRVESGEWTQPSPIGFYFAKLWYYEKLYPMIFTVAALNRVRASMNLV